MTAPDHNPVRIGFLLFPEVLQLDYTGPYAVLAACPGVVIHSLWKDAYPVRSSDGLLLSPNTRFADCPPLDVVCVPGGGGVSALLNDPEIHAFLRAHAENCRYLCSVCTGALILGAAGLLRGYKAATHWQSLDLLPLFGAEPQTRRVVLDGNRVTSAGVSAGIDMALLLAGMIWGDETAQSVQLAMEYAPEPPYGAGSPASAPPDVVDAVNARTEARRTARRKAAIEAAARAYPSTRT